MSSDLLFLLLDAVKTCQISAGDELEYLLLLFGHGVGIDFAEEGGQFDFLEGGVFVEVEPH